jgi:hypothetical protein
VTKEGSPPAHSVAPIPFVGIIERLPIWWTVEMLRRALDSGFDIVWLPVGCKYSNEPYDIVIEQY